MKLKHLLLAVAVTACFVYYTSSAIHRVMPNAPRLALADGASGSPAENATALQRAEAGLGPDERNNIEVYRDSSPAVVNITTKTLSYDFFMNEYPSEGAGSGFLIDAEGHIVTNNHVVAGARSVSVAVGKDSKRYTATVVGTDDHSDIAVLQIKTDKKLPFIKLGDSASLLVGQKVLAIGNPFGQFQNTLTTGVISSLGRTIRDENNNEMEEMIQTDAAINHGNSGGPLLNSHGEVIGINSAIIGPAYLGIGFAIPVNRAKEIVSLLLRDGRVQRPWLGVQMVTVNGPLAEALELPAQEGALVVQLVANSPAEHGGVHGPDRMAMLGFQQFPIGGDFIVAIDGKPVATREDVIRVIDHHKVGDELKLTIYRKSRKMELTIKLTDRPVPTRA